MMLSICGVEDALTGASDNGLYHLRLIQNSRYLFDAEFIALPFLHQASL